MAANRTFDVVKTFGKNRVVISGSFETNGSSNPPAATIYGKGFSVVRTSTGLYTLTVNDAYGQLDCIHATLQLATAADQFCSAGAVSLTNKTAVITTWDISGTGVADIANDAVTHMNRVNFILVYRATGSEY